MSHGLIFSLSPLSHLLKQEQPTLSHTLAEPTCHMRSAEQRQEERTPPSVTKRTLLRSTETGYLDTQAAEVPDPPQTQTTRRRQ